MGDQGSEEAGRGHLALAGRYVYSIIRQVGTYTGISRWTGRSLSLMGRQFSLIVRFRTDDQCSSPRVIQMEGGKLRWRVEN